MSRPLLLHCLDGLGVGGAERQLLLLLAHTRGGVFTHAVCHLGPRRDLAPEVARLGVALYDLSSPQRRPVTAVRRLVRLIRRLRPALLHADHDYAKLCARVAVRVTGVPFMVTVGNMVPSGPQRRQLAGRVRALAAAARLFSAPPARVLAISEAVAQALVARGVARERISVVRRGLDLSAFAPDPPETLAALRRSLSLDGAAPVLLHVGRLVRQKQQDVLIRALPAVARRHPGVCLLLAGEGPERAAYAALAAQEGVADRVRLLGLRSDVPSLLQIADLFLFPSVREGTGVALLEAMAYARACVASDIPALAEVLGGNGAGLLIPPRRPDRLADAVTALLDDPRRRGEMGRRARQVVEERYDIRRSTAGFEATAVEAIAAARGRGGSIVGAEAR